MPQQRNVEPTAECIFDGVISGRVASHVVLDEPALLAFLDYRPVFDGHTLIVPRAHYANLAEAPGDLLGPLLDAGRRVAAAQVAALGAEGAFFALNENVSQSVPATGTPARMRRLRWPLGYGRQLSALDEGHRRLSGATR